MIDNMKLRKLIVTDRAGNYHYIKTDARDITQFIRDKFGRFARWRYASPVEYLMYMSSYVTITETLGI